MKKISQIYTTLTIPLAVKFHAYNGTNHLISKTFFVFICNYNGTPATTATRIIIIKLRTIMTVRITNVRNNDAIITISNGTLLWLLDRI
jgi:hypothetical protein